MDRLKSGEATMEGDAGVGVMNDLLNKEWKIDQCVSGGADCWCRAIVPVDPVDEDDYIIGYGLISKDVAKHIVKLHNESLPQLNNNLTIK